VAAEEMHIRRAAERLAIAQPPLTQQIKALESELGVKLFARAGRGVALTEAGRIFHTEAKAILEHVDRATALARQVATGYAGRLRVGFTESASFSPVLTKAFTTFRATWPGVELLLEENHTEGLIEALEQGALEAAFVRPPLRASSTIVFEALVSEPMRVAVPLGHRLARCKSVSLRDLADESFVVYPRQRGSGLSDSVITECRRVGFAPRIAQQTPQLSATINLVAASMGIAVVPECMRQMRPESVTFVKLSDRGLMAHLGVAYHQSDRSKTVRNLVDIAIAART
jgi:DNA-binding transcriptional LysR family regulator